MADSDSSSSAQGNRVQVIDRAFILLRALLARPQGASALELAQATRIDRTTVHRLLRTLAHWGMVQTRDGAYLLGPECLVFGGAHPDRLAIQRAALPHAVELQEKGVRKRRAVVSLSMPALDEVVVIERIWTPATPLSIVSELGSRYPIDAAVSGRAILAMSSREAALARVGSERLALVEPRLARIRADGGISFGLSEVRPGVGTMACPIMRREGEPAAAIIIAGLAMEDELRPDSDLARHAMRAAKAISALLGGVS